MKASEMGAARMVQSKELSGFNTSTFRMVRNKLESNVSYHVFYVQYFSLLGVVEIKRSFLSGRWGVL